MLHYALKSGFPYKQDILLNILPSLLEGIKYLASAIDGKKYKKNDIKLLNFILLPLYDTYYHFAVILLLLVS